MDPDFFTRVFGVISENAGRGAQGTGQVADWLITAGLSAAEIAQILNGVATSAESSPAHVAYVQNELRYLNSAYETKPSVLPLVALAAFVWWASRD